MDCCDLTGSEPAWALQQPACSTPGVDGDSLEDHTAARERSRSLNKDYLPSQQQQRCPVPPPQQTSYRPDRLGTSSCNHHHQQQDLHIGRSNFPHNRTQFNPAPNGGCRQPSPRNPAGAANTTSNSNGLNSSMQSFHHQHTPAYTAAEGGSWGNMRSSSPRGHSQWGPPVGRGRGSWGGSQIYARPYNAAEAGSWGSTQSDSAVDRYQRGPRAGFRPNQQQQQGGSYSNLQQPSDRGFHRCNSTGYLGYNNANSSSRLGYSGRGNNGSASNGGRMYRSGSGGLGFGAGRGFGGSRQGPAGQGSEPPPWVKQGCWLVPKPGSSFEQTCRAAPAAGPVAIVAGILCVDTEQQEVLDLTADPTVQPAPADDGVSAEAAANGASSSSNSSSDNSWLGQDKVVMIMRGLPGAGKSTRAAQIVAEAEAAAATAAAAAAAAAVDPVGLVTPNDTAPAAVVADSTGPNASSNTTLQSSPQSASVLARASTPAAAIHSTDSFFIDSATAVYTFDVQLLSINHQRNLDAFCASLTAGVRTVIVDNTNIQPWQFEKYVTAAWAAGYKVREEIVGQYTEAAAAEYAARNVHGVPYEKLLMMLDQWRQQ